jgi:hypothetical protein
VRDYGKVSPAFWITGSGKALRGHPEAQIVGLYLMTCPHANMIGLYYLALATLIHETGLTAEQAASGLAKCAEEKFAFYDSESELAYTPNGATYQVGEFLTGGDKRKVAVLRELRQFSKHAFAELFFRRYKDPYELDRPVWLKCPFQGASGSQEPLRSQDQEQKQEQAQDQEKEQTSATVPVAVPAAPESQTGIRHRSAGGGTSNRMHDGCGGFAIDAFEAGVTAATKRPLTKVSGGALAQLLSVFDAHFPSIPSREQDVRTAAESFANAETTPSAFRFAEWMDRGRRTSREVADGIPPFDPNPPKSIGIHEIRNGVRVDSLTQKPIVDGVYRGPHVDTKTLPDELQAELRRITSR